MKPALGPAAFDAASIKPSPPGDPFDYTVDPSRLTAHDLDLKTLIRLAYDLKAYQVQAPSWMEQEHFDIDAETQQPVTPQQMDALLKQFLIQQFVLVTQSASSMVNVYALEVNAGGPKLDPAPADAAYTVTGLRPNSATIRGTGSIEDLAAALTRMVDRPVIDATGLQGTYKYTLSYTPGPENLAAGRRPMMQEGNANARGGPPSAGPLGAPDPAAPSLFTALPEQLGLKLVPRKGPITVLVIAQARKTPLGN